MNQKTKKILIKLKDEKSTAIENAQYNIDKLAVDIYFSMLIDDLIKSKDFYELKFETSIEDIRLKNEILGNLLLADSIIKNHLSISS